MLFRSTNATGNGTNVTLTFNTQSANPFDVGQTIIVTGLSVLGYNGTYTVTGVSTSSVTYANTTTGTINGDGIVSSPSAIYTAINLVGATVTGSPSINSNSVILSYNVDPNTDAIVSIVINKPTINTIIPSGTSITITEPTTLASGYYLKFSSPPPYGKPVTALIGFDQ